MQGKTPTVPKVDVDSFGFEDIDKFFAAEGLFFHTCVDMHASHARTQAADARFRNLD